MDPLLLPKLVDGHRRGWQAGASDFDAVVEHPYFDRRAGKAIVAVRDRIDERLLPGEERVFEALAEKQVVQQHPLTDVFLDTPDGLIDEPAERRLETNPFDDVELRSVPSLGSLVFDEVDASARMPPSRLFGE